METKAKKKWKTPHTFVILVVIILSGQLLWRLADGQE